MKPKKQLYYGWIIVIIFMVVQALLIGVHSAFTVFFKHIEAEFALSRTTTSAISSVAWVLIPMTAFAGGWAMDRYGPKKVLFFMGLFTGLSLVLTSRTTDAWQLFLTYSVLLSIGFGAIYAVAISTISRWFDKKRGLAVGIAGSGEGIGSVAMAPLSTFLISSFNWKTAYLILGIIIWAISLPLSFLAKREPSEIGLLPDGVRPENGPAVEENVEEGDDGANDLTVVDILKSGSFWVVAGVWFCFSFCMVMLMTHMVPHLTDMGISAEEAALIVGILGAARAVGMIGLGGVADRFGRKKVAITAAVVQVAVMAWLIWAEQSWMLYLFAVFYGLANGGLFSGITPLLGDTFGLNRLGTVLGLLEIGWGIGAAIGPLIGGYLFDTYGSYTWAFIIGAVIMAGVIFLLVILKPVKAKKLVR